jgi:preprotein translocase subunit SecF
MNIIKHRYLYFAISLLVIVPGIIALIVWGLPLAIDFTGGSMLEIKFDSGAAPQPAQVFDLLTKDGVIDSQVQTSGTDGLIIHAKEMDEVTWKPLSTAKLPLIPLSRLALSLDRKSPNGRYWQLLWQPWRSFCTSLSLSAVYNMRSAMVLQRLWP